MKQPILPQTVKRLISLIGLESTHLLIKHFGGIALIITKGMRRSGAARYEAIAKVIGYESMEKLSKAYGGLSLSIPRCHGILTALRHQKIQSRYRDLIQETGRYQAANILADEFGITARAIYSILENTSSPAQESDSPVSNDKMASQKTPPLSLALIERGAKEGIFSNEILEAIGVDCYYNLVAGFGGKSIRIPTMRSESGLLHYEKLADIIGYDAARPLAKQCAGEFLSVPTLIRISKLKRNVEIILSFEKMTQHCTATAAVEHLAQLHCLTSRSVWKILKSPIATH